MISVGELGRAGKLSQGAASSRVPQIERLLAESIKSDDFYALGRILPRQLGLCPRVSVGASRRVRRGPSLGGMTPAGAIEPRHTERCKCRLRTKGIAGAVLPSLCC